MSSNDWNEYQRLVLAKLESLEKGHATLQSSLNTVMTELAVLKVKAGLWGALAGVVTGSVAYVTHWFTRRN